MKKAKKFRNWICSSLAFLVLCAIIPFQAFADKVETVSNTTDFVLVVDCSATMSVNDPNGLCMDACKMFLDLIPEEETRVSVIAFGYQDGTGHEYQNYEVEFDSQYVHVITPLQNISSKDVKSQTKNNLNVLSKNWSKTMTPIGEAMLAAVDVLETNGTVDGQAAIILMSDGIAAPTTIPSEKQAIETSITQAKTHDWPIYCIQLDFDRKGNTANPYIGSTPTELMTRICEDTGAGDDGRRNVGNPTDVGEAFLNVFDRFFGGDGDIELANIGVTGKAELEFEVPDLVSETSVVVVGSGIEKLILSNLDEGTTTEIKGNVHQDNLIVTVENDSYYAIKLICPKAGNWKITAYGNPNANIVAYHNSIQELSLTMIAVPSSDAKELNKNDTVACEAFFSYSGYEVHDNSFYTTAPAKLVVVNNKSGITKEFDMIGTNRGYHCDLDVSSVGSGEFEVYTLLRSTMFRNGQKVSNAVTFSAINLPIELIGNKTISVSGYVNSAFEKIDLAEYISNPDGDPIDYELVCTSNRSVTFESSVTDDYMEIQCGMIPGEFDGELTATEDGLAAPLTVPVKISITDRPVELAKLPKIELWVDAYSFQKDVGHKEMELDAAEYATDPDGVPISVVGIDTTSDENGGMVSVEKNGTVLKLTPEAEGEVELRVTISDGVENYDEVFRVRVVSGKTVFWRTNWWKMAIAAAILFVIIFTLVVLLCNKRMKGKWDIRIETEDGTTEVEQINITSLRIGKKRKFKLVQLLQELEPYMTGHISPRKLEELYDVNDFRNIELGGVFFGHGCAIRNIPKNSDVHISQNGRELEKNAKMHGGNLRIDVINPIGGDAITVELQTY